MSLHWEALTQTVHATHVSHPVTRACFESSSTVQWSKRNLWTRSLLAALAQYRRQGVPAVYQLQRVSATKNKKENCEWFRAFARLWTRVGSSNAGVLYMAPPVAMVSHETMGSRPDVYYTKQMGQSLTRSFEESVFLSTLRMFRLHTIPPILTAGMDESPSHYYIIGKGKSSGGGKGGSPCDTTWKSRVDVKRRRV